MMSSARGHNSWASIEDTLPSIEEIEEAFKRFAKEDSSNSDSSLSTCSDDEDEDIAPIKIDTTAAAKSGDPSLIRVLSWNLDGLDPLSLTVRTKSALQAIIKEDPDVIFLQEVVDRSWAIIQSLSTFYHVVPAALNGRYITMVLLKRASVLFNNHKVRPFHTTSMGRKLQILEVNVKGVDVKLMNTHLESTGACTSERLRQLKFCFKEAVYADSTFNVIFGGDLNLASRDARGIAPPSNVKDIWEALGSNEETRYTWDTKYNDNKVMSFGQPRCRFDRIYFRPSSTQNIAPSKFMLSGIEREPNSGRFPSDHWAILCEFAINNNLSN